MSSLRPIVASAVAVASLVLAARSAEAAPMSGYRTAGKEYSKSIAKGDFGAGFQIYAKVHARDYDQLCATTQASVQCAPFVPIGGTVLATCQTIWNNLRAGYCAQHGMGFGARGKAEADVTLFGTDFELFEIGASADAEPSGISTNYGIYILGAKIRGETGAATLSRQVNLAERTLVTATSTFMVGPVPITVKAKGVGSLGIGFSLAAGTASVTGTATPWAEIDGIFSAGVGVSYASAGIEGEIVLVKVSAPASATMKWEGGKTFGYDAALDLKINSLDGSVSLYGEAGSYKKSWEIFSWSGLDYTMNLGRTTGSFSL